MCMFASVLQLYYYVMLSISVVSCPLLSLSFLSILDDFDKDIDVFGKIICNRASRDIRVTVCGSKVIIPSSSSFLLSDICKVQLLKNFSTYNVIVVDPPWENRSAIRGGK